MRTKKIFLLIILTIAIASPFLPFVYYNFILENTSVLPIDKLVDIGSSKEYLVKGWHHNDSGLTWISGDTAEIQFQAASADTPMVLTINCIPLVHEDMKKQQVIKIYVNGKSDDYFYANGETSLKVYIPTEMLKSKINIKIELQNSNIPTGGLELSDNAELYGLAVKSIKLENAMNYCISDKVSIENVFEYGMHETEESHTWMSDRAEMFIAGNGTDLDLIIKGFAFISKGVVETQIVNIYINDRKIETVEVYEQTDSIIKLSISHNDMLKGYARIRFEMPNAKSPSELGVSNDTRVLSYAVKQIEIKESSIK